MHFVLFLCGPFLVSSGLGCWTRVWSTNHLSLSISNNYYKIHKNSICPKTLLIINCYKKSPSSTDNFAQSALATVPCMSAPTPRVPSHSQLPPGPGPTLSLGRQHKCVRHGRTLQWIWKYIAQTKIAILQYNISVWCYFICQSYTWD